MYKRQNIDQPVPPASGPRGAESPQGPSSLPRADRDAADMTRVKVDFGIKYIVKNLRDPAITDAQKGSLILGLHEKFWHAPAARLIQLLERAGCPKAALELAIVCSQAVQALHAICTR